MSKFKTFVNVDFGGEERIMKFDFNSAADLEDHFGLGVSEIFNEKRIGFSLVRAFYFFGLREKMKGLTMQRTGLLLQEEVEKGKTLETLLEPVMEALELSKLLSAPKETEGK